MRRHSAQDEQSLISAEEQLAQHCLWQVDALHPQAHMCAEGLRHCNLSDSPSVCKKRFIITRIRDARVAPACSVVAKSATVASCNWRVCKCRTEIKSASRHPVRVGILKIRSQTEPLGKISECARATFLFVTCDLFH